MVQREISIFWRVYKSKHIWEKIGNFYNSTSTWLAFSFYTNSMCKYPNWYDYKLINLIERELLLEISIVMKM